MWRLFARLQLVQVNGLSWRTKGTLQTWQHICLRPGAGGAGALAAGAGSVLRRSAGLESRSCAGGAAAV